MDQVEEGVPATPATQPEVVVITGMSGAGRTNVAKVLEDEDYFVVDNLPPPLIKRVVELAFAPGSSVTRLALVADVRGREFFSELAHSVQELQKGHEANVRLVFLEASDNTLASRFNETRRRHPQAQDRPAAQGILIERDMMMPPRRWAEHVIDTSDSSANDLRVELRHRFSRQAGQEMTVTIASFGFARGILRNADMVFDMRFLRNPHWDETLRPMTGKDKAVVDYIAEDPAYEDAVGYLIGEENMGMRIMFVMMNNARLSVGLEGLAIAERAYQQALQ